MKMKLLEVVTPPSIYHCCSIWKMFWEGIFKLGKFTAVNMKHFGHRSFRKQRDIKDSDKYITLDILLKFVSLDKMRITSSEPKGYLRISGKGLIISQGLKTNVRPMRYKKTRYAITNVSMKYLPKIIKEFKKLPYKGYVWKRPKHEPTDSYFYLARQLTKCTMIDDNLNLHVYPVRMEMTGMQQIPISYVCDSYKSE